MLNDLSFWGSDEKALELGYSVSELLSFCDHAKKGSNFHEFAKRTQSCFQMKNAEFYHNLAVLKTAALWISKFNCDVEYLLPDKNRLKSPDLLVKDPRGVYLAVEVKQKTKLNNRIKKIKNFGLNSFDEFSKLGYDMDLRLTEAFHLQKDLDNLFPTLINFVKQKLSEGQLSGSDQSNLIIWVAKKRIPTTEGHHTLRTINYPYIKYWSRDKPILEEAHAQIASMMKTNPRVKLGVIVLDLCHLDFDVNDAIDTINNWRKTKKNLMILILLHSGFQYKNRTSFSDDFFTVTGR
ncbi:hypothetical protein HY990_00745 [Candidatus Micrarchaeota archaeon]|nr:hypothetical protein [Candidatus Micrarchaeota archaeon]